MKSFVIMFVVSCAANVFAEKEKVTLPQEKTMQILQVAMPCIGETGVSADQIFQYRSGKTISGDRNFQKFIYCVSTKAGYSDKNGHVKINKALEVFPEKNKEDIRKVLEQCNKEVGADPPETAFRVAKCFRRNSPVLLVI